MASSCVCTSPLAVMTIVGLHDFVKVSISAEFKSFLLTICIDAPESTTNSCSLGLRVDAGRHLLPKVRRMLLFDAPLILTHFWPASTLLRGTLHLPLSLPETDTQTWSVGATLMRFTWAYQSERRILVANVCVTCNGFREYYTSDRIPYVWALP